MCFRLALRLILVRHSAEEEHEYHHEGLAISIPAVFPPP